MLASSLHRLTGNAEHCKESLIENQNQHTQCRTDPDTEADRDAVSFLYPLRLPRTDILTSEAGNRRMEAVRRNMRDLLDLLHGCIAFDTGSAEGVHQALQHSKAESGNHLLKSNWHTQAQQQTTLPLSHPFGNSVTDFFRFVYSSPQILQKFKVPC